MDENSNAGGKRCDLARKEWFFPKCVNQVELDQVQWANKSPGTSQIISPNKRGSQGQSPRKKQAGKKQADMQEHYRATRRDFLGDQTFLKSQFPASTCCSAADLSWNMKHKLQEHGSFFLLRLSVD